MSRRQCLIGVSLLMLALGGCASARLSLDLDLYAEDPMGSLIQLTPVRVAELDSELKALAREIGPLVNDRQELADDIFQVYEAVIWAMYTIEGAAKAASDPNIEAARSYRERHKKRLAELGAEARKKVADAENTLDRYVQGIGQSPSGETSRAVTELSLLRAINEAVNAVAKLGGPVETEFERLLVNYWPTVARNISSTNVANLRAGTADTPELIALRQQVRRLADRVKLLRERGRKIPTTALTALDEAFKESRPTPGQLKSSFDKLILAVTEVSTSLALPDQLQALVRSSAAVFNLVDRLQDPADPIWRTISQPGNESKWRNSFTETFFYAEGNTSVVIVRDTPFSFRVLKATNNPTALVQGQLQISRAIANAAIAIAGAATGAPVPKLPGASGPSVPADGDEGTNPEQLAKRKAKVERQLAVRAQAIRNLRRDLAALRGQLERAQDQAAVDTVLEQVQALLKAHDILLAPPGA
jgi:hypothetical protein